jgi:hypothetical protein
MSGIDFGPRFTTMRIAMIKMYRQDDTLEVGAALRSHTLTHCDEERKKIVAVGYGKTGRDIEADLRSNEIGFAVL